MKRSVRDICLFVVALFFWAACDPGEPQAVELEPDPEPQETAVETPAEELTEAETIGDGIVTFLVGNAFSRNGTAEWQPLDIGDPVYSNYSIRSGPDSYLDIQFGTLATVRLESDTTVTIADLSRLPESRRATVELGAGTLLNKVERLRGDDQFRVGSRSAVAGVRGTEFAVSALEDGSTRVSVRSGRVVVTSRVITRLRDLATRVDDAQIVDVVSQVVRSFEDAAELLSNEERIVVAPVDTATEALLVSLVETAQQVVEDPGIEREPVRQDARRLADELLSVPPARVPATTIPDDIREKLRQIDTIRVLPVPSEPDGVSAEAEISPLAASIRDSFARVSFVVEPSDASVFIDGQSVGRTTFSGLFAQSSQIQLEAYADNYEPYFREITVESTDDQLITVSMQAVEEPEDPEPDTTAVTQPEDESPAPPEPTPRFQLTLQTEPSNASISLDGRPVGRGRYSASVEEGTRLSFVLTADGFETEERTVTVGDRDQNILVTLQRLERSFTVQAEPASAEIRLGRELVGRGSYSGTFPVGEQLQFDISAPGYVSQTIAVTITEDSPLRQSVRLEREQRTLSFSVVPDDADIRINGQRVARGNHTQAFPTDQSISVEAARDGFAPQRLTIDPSRDERTRFSIVLEPRPIEARFQVSGSPLVRGIVRTGSTFIAADRAGTITAVSTSGQPQWSVATANEPNENSRPVFAFNRVFFSGSSERVVVNASDGTVLNRENLDSDSAHIFGRRAVPDRDRVFYPTNRSIVLLDQSGATTGEIELPAPSSMTPAVVGNEFIIADQQGTVLFIDTSSGVVVREVETSATQPVSLAPAISGGVAYIAGRRGDIVALDVQNGAVRWSTVLDPDRSMGAFVDPVVGARSVFFFSRDTVYPLNVSDGERSFEPITGVTAPPAVHGNQLVIGVDTGALRILDAASGQLRAEVQLGSRVTTRPLEWNGRYVVGLESGEIVIVNPVGILE